MSLEGDLKSLPCGDIDASEATCLQYSHDASVFEVRPTVVVFPYSSDDVARLVSYAREHPGVALTARAAGTCMTGGAIGHSVIVEMTRHMNRVVDVSREASMSGQDGHVVVQPGAYYRDVERETLARELQYPSYPASRDLCAVGGIVSNNAGGEKSLTYGQTVDWVRSVKVVLADGKEYEMGPLNRAGLEAKMKQSDFEGEVYRNVYGLLNANREEIAALKPKVSKNSAGYLLWKVWDGTTFNLAKLMCGSQGTFGIRDRGDTGTRASQNAPADGCHVPARCRADCRRGQRCAAVQT